jgi:hypothetical protein
VTRTRRLALIVGALALLLGGGWLGVRTFDAQATAAAKKEVAHLQTLATSACRCTREKGEAARKACWQAYRAATADKDVTQMDIMCAWAPSKDCISTYAGEECIVTDFGEGICTQEEARAVEAAYSAALTAEGEFSDLDDLGQARANERANAAVQSIVRRLRAGEKVSAPPGARGCAG